MITFDFLPESTDPDECSGFSILQGFCLRSFLLQLILYLKHILKVELFNIKTFHEVVDQIYYKVPTPDMILVAVIKLVFYQVDHLEPWATGSRKTAGRSKWYSPSILVLISSSPIHYIAICHHYNVVQYISTSLFFIVIYGNKELLL